MTSDDKIRNKKYIRETVKMLVLSSGTIKRIWTSEMWKKLLRSDQSRMV